eukprot:912028-Rhodomonas_salina.2
MPVLSEHMGSQDICIDSRVRGEWTMQYYIDTSTDGECASSLPVLSSSFLSRSSSSSFGSNHMTGGFFNDAKGTGRPYNCV